MSHHPGADATTESVDSRLRRLEIVLPPAPVAIANYLPFAISKNLLYLSGQGPGAPDGSFHLGKVGDTVSVEDAYLHARLAGIRLLSVAQLALGSLDRVQRIVKLLGLVNSAANFKDHPKVINGCSDLMVEVFGESGRHARSAIGVNSLPRNMTVEIEAIIEIRA